MCYFTPFPGRTGRMWIESVWRRRWHVYLECFHSGRRLTWATPSQLLTTTTIKGHSCNIQPWGEGYNFQSTSCTQVFPIDTEKQISRQPLKKKVSNKREKSCFVTYSLAVAVWSVVWCMQKWSISLSVSWYLTVAGLRNCRESTETCSPLFELIITGPGFAKQNGKIKQNNPDKRVNRWFNQV